MNLDFQTYFLSLLESNYLAGMQQGLTMQKRILKETLNKDKYNVQANANLTKVNSDLKKISAILQGHHNIINNYLQETYDFKFESIKVTGLPEEPVLKVEKPIDYSDGSQKMPDGTPA